MKETRMCVVPTCECVCYRCAMYVRGLGIMFVETLSMSQYYVLMTRGFGIMFAESSKNAQ